MAFYIGGGNIKWLCKKCSLCPPCKRLQHQKEYDLVHKWAKNEGEAKKKGFDQPSAPHEQWHTDISYIKVLGVFYYFISIMDGYSRKILDWALCENMEGINIELLVARVKEKYPEAKARIIHDNGKQFISKDFKSLVSLLELYDHRNKKLTLTSKAQIESPYMKLYL